MKGQNKAFRVGDWIAQPELNSLSRDGVEHHLEPKVMQVLRALASQPNHVLSKESLIAEVWPDTFVSDDALARCISILRRVTEDDPHAPHFIQTVPKAGYRLVAAVSEWTLPGQAAVVAMPVPPETLAENHLSGTDSDKSSSSIPPVALTPVSKRRTFPLAVVFVPVMVLLLVIFSLLYGRRKPGSSSASSFRMLQFTTLAGEQTQPAFSPDGKSIVFVLIPENGSSRQIYIKKIGSEQLIPVAPSADEQFSPAWSPSGQQIAWLSQSQEGLGIYVMDLATKSTPSRIFIPRESSHWEQGALSWSPDGKNLIFPDHAGDAPNSSIYQLNVQSGEAHSITSPPAGWEGDLNPAWSPDGQKIAFTRASETAVRDIYWLTVPDGKVHQLTHDHMDIDSLAWTTDSRSIVFSSNREGKYALWKMRLIDASPQRLPVGTEDAYQPAVGPQPDQLAYTQGQSIWGIVRLQAESHGMPSAASVVLASTAQDSAPSLSPDGKFFAMQSLRSGAQEIWISSINGDTLRQLTFMSGPVTGSPAWSHHGSQILFDSRPDGHSHIFMIPATGGQPRQLTFGNNNDIIPRWSQDDQTIYFRSNRGGRWQLWKVSANGGNEQPVTSLDGIVPQESLDGKYLYHARGDEDGIWRIPTTGGAEAKVLPQPCAGYWGYWAITPHGLFYLERTQTGTRIRVFDPETQKNTVYTTLQHAPPLFSGISVSNDGSFVLMTDEQRASGRHITLVEAP